MVTYLVHDDLRLTVNAYYTCDEAERNTNQWCRVQEIITRPTVLEAYQASIDKFRDFYTRLAS